MKRQIELEVRATVVVHSEDESIIDAWNIEELRHRVFDICESSAQLILPAGIRATVRFTTPTPFDLKAAQLGRDVLESLVVSPLPDEPDVQVVARWRHKVATLAEIVALRRVMPSLHTWQISQIIERAKGTETWVLGVCQPARAQRIVHEADRNGLRATIEAFVTPSNESPDAFAERWGCEVPKSWWPRAKSTENATN